MWPRMLTSRSNNTRLEGREDKGKGGEREKTGRKLEKKESKKETVEIETAKGIDKMEKKQRRKERGRIKSR